MATKIYLRRGTRAEILGIVPEEGEPVWATDTEALYIDDGVTSGGVFSAIGAHASSHEDGQSDEISITGLAGESAELASHKLVKSANAVLGHVIVESASLIDVDGDGKLTLGAHASTHQNGGSDEISVSGLSGLLADNQTPTAHASDHTDGTDDIQDAVADGSTKGIATFAAADFDAAAGVISLVAAQSLRLVELVSDHDYSGLVCSGIAGETLVFGDSVYYKGDNLWYHTDADARETIDGHAAIVVSGVAVSGVLDLLLIGYVRDDSWSWGNDDKLYFSPVAGEMQTSFPSGTGQFVRRAGYAHQSNVVWFHPDGTVIERT